MPATANRLNQFHTETAHDEELALLKHTVQNGWPQDICDLPKEIQPYWTFCEDDYRRWHSSERNSYYSTTHLMSLDDPSSPHWTPWIGKMLKQNQIVYAWPRLYDELKELITKCTTWLKFSSKCWHVYLTDSLWDMNKTHIIYY